MSLHKIATVLNEWWDTGEPTAFVAEETMIGIYSTGIFVGVLYWRIQPTEPMTMVVSFVKSEEILPVRDTIRFFLLRTLSAILPSYIRIHSLTKI
jgi:hypothetical protein